MSTIGTSAISATAVKSVAALYRASYRDSGPGHGCRPYPARTCRGGRTPDAPLPALRMGALRISNDCQNTLFFAIDDIARHKRRQLKVQHSHRFEPDRIKLDLGLMDKAWEAFIEKVRKMAQRQFEPKDASSFFKDILLEKDAESLSARAERDHASLMSLYQSAPGQELESAKGTLWGTVNAVSYYVDHVRFGGAGDRLDGAWFGAGARLKNEAWVTACDLLG